MNEPIPMSLSLPTQTYDDNIDEGAADGENSTNLSTIWGRLLSIDKLFPSIDLIDQEYTLGRGKTCTIVFNSSEVQTSKYFLAYSSQHFKIIRDAAKKYVYVVDLSSNGTYINGEKLGKNKQQILENNAEIALASKTHRVYVYIDSNTSEDVSIPAVIRDKYIVSREIGRGAYGEVRLCFNRDTCDRFAMKIIAKKHFTNFGPQAAAFNQNIKNECSILQGLCHPCIIRIHEVFDTPNTLNIMLDLVDGGELFDRVIAHGQFDEATSKFLFRQMCIGVKYLHDRSITHRDLKPENILLASSDTNETLIKITDFGLSKLINEISLMKTFCGTPNYIAPEVLANRGAGSYTNKVDVWSLGVILYICLVGYPPFSESPDTPPLSEQILKGLYTFPDEFWSEISAPAKDLIRQMMCVDPTKRLTITSVLEHPWLANDHDNTARVDKIMYPTLQTMKSMKRAACDEEIDMDQGDETPSADIHANGKNNKRIKY
ncbi:unnamed protein product [Rotaria socialis]|uniref:Uncharacterized protein n=2 Tax=Rotaria socialis TaxID=392032 RepID=A0A821MJC0_9BILA|nr:unnamed protein product [Rotaria socialis]CAF4769226.1 unnamed protein product [Rotaria socialis]